MSSAHHAVAELELDQDRMIVLSLKPRFAEAILAGTKTVELRRTGPRIVVPTRGLIYATSPVRALVGTCIVTAVQSDRLAVLWRAFGSSIGLSHREFLQYFEGLDTGAALTLTAAEPFGQQIPLAELRAEPRGFRPPQNFTYVDAATGARLLRVAV